MMLLTSSKERTFFVVGFGRGGTSIVAQTLNSVQGAFCLMEPYHYASDNPDPSGHDWTASGPSVAHLLNGNEPLEAIQDALGDQYQIGGYKETIEPVSDWVGAVLPRHLEMVDFFLVVFRHPVFMHSSQRALGWSFRPDEPAAYLDDYRFLAELANTYPGIPVVLEDFVMRPINYLNERLPFRIMGEFRLIPTPNKYGDPAANQSTSMRALDRAVGLSSEEVNQHEEAKRIWASFRN